jgi:hypothetical protein
MSAFHPIATEQRTQFYVGFVPEADVGQWVLHIGFGSYAACPAGAQRAVFQSCADAVCQSNA